MGSYDNVRIFRDTQKMYQTNERLKAAVEHSLAEQRLILEGDTYQTHSGERNISTPTKVLVTKKRSFEAAEELFKKGYKVCVHNFASAGNPGGGVIRGASAQEECLCRCSTLYPCLDTDVMWNGFYRPHRKTHNYLHNDDCIYTPDVIVFKTDTSAPELMDEKDWYTVDVVTCAAPNLREYGHIDRGTLQKLHEKRLRRILDIARENRVEAVVLGAFGCGAFSKPPEVVAATARTVIKEYRQCFDAIEFAVLCRGYNTLNYDAFARALSMFAYSR